MPKKITVYTTNNCAYCVMVKKLLSARGFQYEEVNVEERPDKRQEMIELSGAQTVPVTVVETEDGRAPKITVGYNPAGLMAALNNV